MIINFLIIKILSFLHVGDAPINFTIKNQKKGNMYTFNYTSSEVLPDTYEEIVLQTVYSEVEIGR